MLDRLDECLVPWDFDWSRETAVTDDWFHERTYSLVQELRSAGSRRGVSYQTLLGRVTRRLADLDYEQQPNLVGPSRVTRRRAPLGAGARR